MMSTPQSSPSESDRLGQIVAYLDGELLPEESARVEQQLATDEEFRQELQSIERAWEVLDELPSATVDDKFSKTTMEMVVHAAQGEIDDKTRALPVQRRKRYLATILLATAAILLGGLAFRLSWHNPNRLLRANLPVIKGIDIYSQFRDVDFLRQLRHELGETAWPLQSAEIAAKVEQFQLVSSTESRRDWLENIAEDERVTLRAKFNRFQALPEEQQARLRQLHEAIASADDAPQLQQTMLQYQQWLNGLSASQQFELRRQPSPEARVRTVADLVRQQRQNAAFKLSDAQLRELSQAVREHFPQVFEEMASQMSETEQLRFRKAEPPQKLVFMLRHRAGRELQEKILRVLPRDAREQLKDLPPRRRFQQLIAWLRQTRMMEISNGRHGPVSQQQLEEFFTEELNAATQERLLALPRDKMQQQLLQMYRGGLPQDDWDRPPVYDRPPPRRPGPPRPGEGRRGRMPFERPRRNDRHDERFPPPPDRRPLGES